MEINKIHVFENKDKDIEELYEEHDYKNLMNYKRGFRSLLVGLPSSGKTNFAKNIIINQQRPFDRIILVPLDNSSLEYDCLNAEICAPEDISILAKPLFKGEKVLILLEDCSFSEWKKENLLQVSKTLRFLCSHHGFCLLVCCQQLYSVPVSFRRLMTHFTIFKMPNKLTCTLYCQNLDIDLELFKKLCNKFLEEPFANLTICTDGHKVKLRKNGFYSIDLNNI